MTTIKQQAAILRTQFISIAERVSDPKARVDEMEDVIEKTFGRKDKDLLIALSACTGFGLWHDFDDVHTYIKKFCPDIKMNQLSQLEAREIYAAGAIAEIEAGIV